MDRTQPDDRELVEACRAGDRRAFQELVMRYQRKVFALAYGFLRNQEDALDVVQESFVKVHRYLGNFEEKSSFYTWLYRIVVNLCIDHMRRNRRHKDLEFDDGRRHDGELAIMGNELLPMFGHDDPGDLLHRKEVLLAVRESLDYLSEKHRAVIVMRELQGMSYEEMANAMGCSKGTIMSRLFHARRNMQRLLKERLEFLQDKHDESDERSLTTPEAVLP